MCTRHYKLFFIVLLSLTWVNFSNNTAVSIYEQTIEEPQIYSTNDDVEILTVENFRVEIFNNSRAWFLEFYNNWCGFCIRIAPSWKALATDVKSWRDLVGIGAIDCANEDNYPICGNFELIAYPTVLYFHENYQEGPSNIGQKIYHGFDVLLHRTKLLEIIINEQQQGRGRIYPSLLPYTHIDTTKLFDSVPEKAKNVFLIVQEPDSFLAQEVTMDLHKIKIFVIKYALSNNTQLIKTLNVNKIPSLYVMGTDNILHSLNDVPATRNDYKSTIHNYSLSKHVGIPLDGSNKTIFNVATTVPDMSVVIQNQEKEALMGKIKKMGDVVVPNGSRDSPKTIS